MRDVTLVCDMWQLLLFAPLLTSASWCGCTTSAAGSFSTVLEMGNSSNTTVLLGDSLVDHRPLVFSSGEDRQALVRYLATIYASAQPVAASQTESRCTRYDRGGFQVVVTTGFVIAARNGSSLVWLRAEMDLYATCASTPVNVFRGTKNGIRILPVDLQALDSQADPWGPLVDSTETICRPRAPLFETGPVQWLNRTYDRADVESGLQWWLQNRTRGDMLQRLRICGPRSTDAREGLFYARGADRRYVQVCSFEDAMFCASDAMLLNTPIGHNDTLLFGVALDADGSMATRGTHYKRFQISIGSSNHVISTADFISRGSVMQTVTTMSVFGSVVNSSTVLLVVYASNISTMMDETDRIFGSSVFSFTDCVSSMETLHEHMCDPLVMHDRRVSFGTHDTSGGLTTFISGTHGEPCTPAITAVCPAVHLPAPVFSGATAAGIAMGTLTWTLTAMMAALALYEWPAVSVRLKRLYAALSRRKTNNTVRKAAASPPPTRPVPTMTRPDSAVSSVKPAGSNVTQRAKPTEIPRAEPVKPSKEKSLPSDPDQISAELFNVMGVTIERR